MNPMFSELLNWVEIPLLVNIGMTLVHFLWQGLAIFIGYKLILSVFKTSSANSRYLIACGAMLGYLLAPIITFWQLSAVPVLTQAVVTNQDLITASTIHQQALSFQLVLDAVVPWISLVWLVGVIFYSIKFVIELLKVNDLSKQQVSPVSAHIELALYRLIAGMQVKVPVKLLQSTIAPVPMVIGWLKPVILIPTASLLHLSERQLEMIIAHELAHVKRFDYFVNLIQSLVEVLMFFHPVVRLTSAAMRQEREHICDDIAANYFNDPIGYARALTEAEALRSAPSSLVAVAIDGGSLTSRVSRVAGVNHHDNARSSRWMAGLISIISSCCIIAAIQVQANQRPMTLKDVVSPFESAEQPTIAQVIPKPLALTTAPNVTSAAVPAPAPTATVIVQEPIELAAKPAMIEPIELKVGPETISESTTIPEPATINKTKPKAVKFQPVEAPNVKPLAIDTSSVIKPLKPAFVAPKIISAPMPAYPKYARRKQVEADIDVSFTINTDGTVSIDQLEHRYARYFKSAIESTMSNWRFKPAYKDGQAVAVRSEKRFSFRIYGELESAPIQTGTRIRLVEHDLPNTGLPTIDLPENDLPEQQSESSIAAASTEQVPQQPVAATQKQQVDEQQTQPKLLVSNKQCQSIRLTGSRVGRNTCNLKSLGIKKIQLAAKN